jgi:hypothetical protein
MASELSAFIEKELKNKGYAYDEEDPDDANPHRSLMGALRVEVRAEHGRRRRRRRPRCRSCRTAGRACCHAARPPGPTPL